MDSWRYLKQLIDCPFNGIAYLCTMHQESPRRSANAGKEARQVGTYRYETKNEFVKTVPIVRILYK